MRVPFPVSSVAAEHSRSSCISIQHHKVQEEFLTGRGSAEELALRGFEPAFYAGSYSRLQRY